MESVENENQLSSYLSLFSASSAIRYFSYEYRSNFKTQEMPKWEFVRKYKSANPTIISSKSLINLTTPVFYVSLENIEVIICFREGENSASVIRFIGYRIEEIEKYIYNIQERLLYFCMNLHAKFFAREFRSKRILSDREVEILRFLAAGLKINRIAKEIGISEQGVHLHLSHTRAKLAAKTTIVALLRAIDLGEMSTSGEAIGAECKDDIAA